jgi:hypothetical protein
MTITSLSYGSIIPSWMTYQDGWVRHMTDDQELRKRFLKYATEYHAAAKFQQPTAHTQNYSSPALDARKHLTSLFCGFVKRHSLLVASYLCL